MAGASRTRNAALAADTLRILTDGHYLARGTEVNIAGELRAAVEGSIHLAPEDFTPHYLSVPDSARKYETRITVAAETTLAAARRLATPQEGQAVDPRHVAALNFASAKNPGGGFLKGAHAQEESLARSSGLYPCINQMQRMYKDNHRSSSCLYFHHMVFSPQVPVIRTDNGDLLEKFYTVSIITAPAPNAGVARTRLPNPDSEIQKTMLERIDRILALCMHQGCDALVLGAYGCGVFGNDINKVAAYFDFFLSKKYRNVFARVHFAVPDRAQVFRDRFRLEN